MVRSPVSLLLRLTIPGSRTFSAGNLSLHCPASSRAGPEAFVAINLDTEKSKRISLGVLDYYYYYLAHIVCSNGSNIQNVGDFVRKSGLMAYPGKMEIRLTLVPNSPRATFSGGFRGGILHPVHPSPHHPIASQAWSISCHLLSCLLCCCLIAKKDFCTIPQSKVGNRT